MGSISPGVPMYNYSFGQQEPQSSSNTNYYLESKYQMNEKNNQYRLESLLR
jgi:hypothetical protein